MSLLFPIFFFSSGPALGGEFEVVDVVSGDRIRAEGYGATIHVSLVGIDAPEMVKAGKDFSQPYAQESMEHLSRLVLGKVVEIIGYGRKGHNLFVADVRVGGDSVGLEMVRAGLAEARRSGLPEGFDPQPLLRAEEEARASGTGVWSLGNEYVSPKEWRHRERARAACAVILFGMCGQKEK